MATVFNLYIVKRDSSMNQFPPVKKLLLVEISVYN
jgi:hypothetical protein